MADEFKIGDVVQLKSGGPKMTVTLVADDYGTPMVWCIWFVGTKEQTGKFPPDALARVTPTLFSNTQLAHTTGISWPFYFNALLGHYRCGVKCGFGFSQRRDELWRSRDRST